LAVRLITRSYHHRITTGAPTGGLVELAALDAIVVVPAEEVVPVVVAVIVAIFLSVATANAAPRQLYGKGIEIQ
jgi:hypothetical protein